jgi:hypothetical protein
MPSAPLPPAPPAATSPYGPAPPPPPGPYGAPPSRPGASKAVVAAVVIVLVLALLGVGGWFLLSGPEQMGACVEEWRYQGTTRKENWTRSECQAFCDGPVNDGVHLACYFDPY